MKKRLGLLVFAVCVIAGFIFISCEKETTETNMIIRSWTLKTKTVAGVNIATNCEQDAKKIVAMIQKQELGSWQMMVKH